MKKEFVVSVDADTNKVTVFVRELGVSFQVGTNAEFNILADTDIDKDYPDLRGKISMITAMCKNPTFAPVVLSTPQNVIAFDYTEFMTAIMTPEVIDAINNSVKPTIQ